MIAQALGMSAQSVILIEFIVAIPLMLLIIYFMPVGGRLPVITVLTAGVIVGWVAWLAFAPYLLGHLSAKGRLKGLVGCRTLRCSARCGY
jgi:hypothetical protein